MRTSGIRPGSRAGWSSSTSRSKGSSWWRKASITVPRTSRSSSRKVPASPVRKRSTRVFARLPTSRSVSVRLRPAT